MSNQNFHIKINEILRELESGIPQIETALVCSSYGLPIASSSKDQDETKLAAEISAILSVSEHLVFDSKSGNIDNIIIGADNGILIIHSASTEAVLAVKANPNVRLGMILYEIKKAAKKLEKLFNKNIEIVKETNKVLVYQE